MWFASTFRTDYCPPKPELPLQIITIRIPHCAGLASINSQTENFLLPLIEPEPYPTASNVAMGPGFQSKKGNEIKERNLLNAL